MLVGVGAVEQIIIQGLAVVVSGAPGAPVVAAQEQQPLPHQVQLLHRELLTLAVVVAVVAVVEQAAVLERHPMVVMVARA